MAKVLCDFRILLLVAAGVFIYIQVCNSVFLIILLGHVHVPLWPLYHIDASVFALDEAFRHTISIC